MHPYQGARIVAQMEGYGPVSDIILAHHERIDGKGYPRGLQRRGHPAAVAHHLGRRHLRRDDRARLLPRRRSRRSRRSRSCAACPARSSTRSTSRSSSEILAGKDVRFRHGEDADFDAELGLDKRVDEHTRSPSTRWRSTARPPRSRREQAEQADARRSRGCSLAADVGRSRRPAQLAGRPLGRHDVDVQAGAQLEAGEACEPRQDVDVPVEVVRAARRGAHPEVERRRRPELRAQPAQALAQQVAAPPGRRPRSSASWRRGTSCSS